MSSDQPRRCGDCEVYSSNQPGCWQRGLCIEDMMDESVREWFRVLPPEHECHRGRTEV